MVLPWCVCIDFLEIATHPNTYYLQVSGEQTIIEGVLILLAIPLFIYGERLRRHFSRFDV